MNKHIIFIITSVAVAGIAPMVFKDSSRSLVFLALVLVALWLQTYWRDILIQFFIARGQFAVRKGNRELLEASYRKIYRLSPTGFAGKMSAGVIYTLYGNWKQAETFFRQALYLKPGNLYICLNLAVVLIKSEQYIEARKMLYSLIFSYPRCVQAYLMMAEAYYRLGELYEAKKYLLVARILDQGNIEIKEFLLIIQQELEKAA
ncbi:Tetratricopeptide repeat-containing protein [Desulfotomaculum arcticum]|uniref:Tetratricopeptide repeat-containing protein n=1 Tax=Desulfotruncus arcticus DSM 17038 TaxID=1121424 RepID=A0A1I2UIW7_9FIRM|nr:tetratricopeptide repeat protein [Desulfotruncus arcticus]SFG75597.1 Tetratricopeptide repeat-containing protein [Desulfotomaculum arcticum] [Desulfotruncus arcticus DSM 17038]